MIDVLGKISRHTIRFKGKMLVFKGLYKLLKFAGIKQKKRSILKSKEGIKIYYDLNNSMYKNLFFNGEYEPELCSVIKKFVREGDVVLDVGANFGWFSLYLSKIVGASGCVHAFEPMPITYQDLERNIQLNSGCTNIKANRFGLGSTSEETKIHIFKGLSHGHASISKLGRDDYIAYDIRVIDFDTYYEKNIKKGKIRYIKLDVEGYEMDFIKGSKKIFALNPPDIMTIEVNYETSRAFGYEPFDLVAKLKEINDSLVFYLYRSSIFKKLNFDEILINGENLYVFNSNMRFLYE